MFSTDFIFRQQENLVDNQKSQAGYRPLRNKILIPESTVGYIHLHFEEIPHKMEDLVQFYQCIPYSRLEQMNIGKNPFEHCMVEQKSCHCFLASILPHL